MSKTARINILNHAPANLQAMLNLSHSVRNSSLGERLVELVLLRLSQINGCGMCVDMHWRHLMGMDMDPRHLNAVAVWREAPFFTDRERAALRWAEIVNGQPHTDATDEEFALVREHFSETEVIELGYAVAVIKGWNMFNLSLRNPIPVVPLPGM